MNKVMYASSSLEICIRSLSQVRSEHESSQYSSLVDTEMFTHNL